MNKIFFICCLFFVTVACDTIVFRQDDDLLNYFEKNRSSDKNISITFGDLEDSTLIWGNKQINFLFTKNSADLRLIEILMDSILVFKTSDFSTFLNDSNKFSFQLQTRNYSNDFHKLSFKLSYKMNNGSLGDLNEISFFDTTTTKIIRIDNNTPDINKYNIRSFRIDNGLLKFTFPKYESPNFIKYQIFNGSRLVREVQNNNITEIADSNYIGDTRGYSLRIYYQDKYMDSPFISAPAYWDSQIDITQNANYSTTLKWQRNPFFNSLRTIRISRWDIVQNKTYNFPIELTASDTTIIDLNTAFGGTYSYTFEYVSLNGSSRLFNKSSIIYNGTINPSSNNLFRWSSPSGKIYTKDTLQNNLIFYNSNLSIYRSINGGIISENDSLLIQVKDSSINILDPAALTINKTINVGLYFNYKYWVDYYLNLGLTNNKNLPLHLESCNKELSESKIFAINPILGDNFKSFETSDIMFFDLKQEKFLFNYKLESPGSAWFGEISDDGKFFSSSRGLYEILSNGLVISNGPNTGKRKKQRFNSQREYYSISNNKLDIYNYDSGMLIRSFLLSENVNGTLTDPIVFTDESNTRLAIYSLFSKKLIIIDSIDGKLIQAIQSECPSSFINNMLFVDKYYLKIN